MRRRCLIVTPATRFGSWSPLEKMIRFAPPETEWLVISYGRRRPAHGPPNVRFVTLPSLFDYVRAGRVMSRRRYLALNGLFNAPLALLAWVVGAFYRPSILVG